MRNTPRFNIAFDALAGIRFFLTQNQRSGPEPAWNHFSEARRYCGGTVMAIDTVETNSLLSLLGKGGTVASILREVWCRKGDERQQKRHHEERQIGNLGPLPDLWHKSIQNRQELGLLLRASTN